MYHLKYMYLHYVHVWINTVLLITWMQIKNMYRVQTLCIVLYWIYGYSAYTVYTLNASSTVTQHVLLGNMLVQDTLYIIICVKGVTFVNVLTVLKYPLHALACEAHVYILGT